MTRRLTWLALLALMLAAAAAPALRASRSGLNNVPNADISAPRVAVIHVYGARGAGRSSTFLTGVRSGFSAGEQKFEAGLDSRWAPGRDVPAFLNAKWARPLGAQVAGGLGVANLAPDEEGRHRLGQPQSYGVLTADLGVARLSGGYAIQAHNDAWFGGLDRKLMLFDRALVLRGDAIQIQDGREWLTSFGATYRFTSVVALELWRSHPSGPARDYTTAKLALHAKF